MCLKGNSRPSIFNDVIGPVMRGPSSSHTAASWRIASLCIQLLNEELREALIEFDEDGAWATNYREQGTTMGIEGGLLGLEITDERIIDSEKIALERGVRIQYGISNFPTEHANTVRLTLTGISGRAIRVIAISTGGGMFEITEFNGSRTRLKGDRFQQFGPVEGSGEMVELKPVLPVLSGNELDFPFTNVEDMLAYAGSNKLSLGQAGLFYERCRSGLSEAMLRNMMREILHTIEGAVDIGLGGTAFADRILQQQSHLIGEAEKAGDIHSGSLVNRVVENITALMEAKSAMEVIVAAPTAGSCGTFGGTVKAYCDTHALGEDERIMAYFAGGLVGAFFVAGPGFSAEEYGCQVETGAAACMAAAALVELSGGSAGQAMVAASMALQNSMGLVCDPVADRVEVPCLGKNVSAGLNALGASTMALSGFDAVIPFDQVLEAVSSVGRCMPAGLRCTGKEGLSVTPKSLEIKRKLEKKS